MSVEHKNVDKSDSSSFEDLAGASELAEENVIESTDKKDTPEEWQDILGSGHILKKIIKEGDPENRPQRTDICRIRYEGRLKNGQVVDKHDNLEIQLGDGDVIQGIDLTLPLMHDGEISEVQVSPRFAFGECGMAPDIPPNSHITYTVELIEFRPEPEIDTLSIKERQAIGNQKRERGNWWYSMQEPALAIQCYRKAIEYLDETKGGITDPTPDGELPRISNDLHSLLSDRMKVYNNMAAAQMKQGAYDAALNSVDTVLGCQPNNVKALFRKGKILSHKNEVSEALKAVRAALALSPDDRFVKAELLKLEARDRKDAQREKELARKMLGGASDALGKSSNEDKSKKGVTKTKLLVWGSVLISIAIGVFSIAYYRYKIME